MRFYEFKLPDPGSSFDAELKSFFLKLVNDARQLPETDPKRIEFNQFLSNLKAEAGVKEDAVADVDMATINAVLAFLSKKDDKVATMYLMDAAEILGDKKVQAALKKKAEVHKTQGKELVKAQAKEKLDKAKKLSKKIGKGDRWAFQLHSILSRYENEQLHNDFLDLCINNKGLVRSLVSGQPLQKINLKDIINPKLLGIFADPAVFEDLAKLPLSDQTGQGSGAGPGESLFACIVPDTKKAEKSDLIIDGVVWEVKGGKNQSATGWLDSSSAKATDLKAAYFKGVDRLAKKPNQVVKNSKGFDVTMENLLADADFRFGRFGNLKIVFKMLQPSERIKTVDAIYTELAPTVKTAPKLKDIFEKSVNDTVDIILTAKSEQDIRPYEKIQAKLSMLEYAIGAYKAENFIIYNYSTQDTILVQGVKGILQAVDGPQQFLTFKSATIFGTGAAKGSPGVQVLITPKTRFSKKTF